MKCAGRWAVRSVCLPVMIRSRNARKERLITATLVDKERKAAIVGRRQTSGCRAGRPTAGLGLRELETHR